MANPIIVLLFCLSISVVRSCTSGTVVQTASGPVQGTLTTSPNGSLRVFYGIPYAQPPVGDKRFRPSSVVTPWEQPLNCTYIKPACIQQTNPSWGMSEDCLTLNIYTPLSTNNELLPVMIWIHGGSFTSGTGSLYNPAALVPHNVVVVTINYRLGPFGYLQSPLIKDENPDYPTLGGMNGIHDQYLAISWVKSNIQYFCGNPNAITLFGESAGSLSLCLLVIAPEVGRDTFSRVIFESGSCLGPWGPKPLEMGLDFGNKLLDYFNATSLDDLRQIPAQQFLTFPFYGEMSPSIDGQFLSQPVSEYYQNLSFNIPDDGAVLLGANSLDTLFTFPFYNGPFPQSREDWMAILTKFFGNDAQKVSQIYPTGGPSDPTPEIVFSTMNAHVCVACPTRLLASVFQQKVPVYLYEFAFNPANGEYHNMTAHFGEVPCVFGVPVFPFPYDESLSSAMRDLWTSFAISGVPSTTTASHNNTDGTLVWPEWRTTHNMLRLNTPISIESGFFDFNCDFWNTYIGNPQNPANYLKVVEYCFQALLTPVHEDIKYNSDRK